MRSSSFLTTQSQGFTLIELMIVVGVSGILAAVAYPSYVGYVQRGNIGAATSQLVKLSYMLEQYYTDNRTYSSTTSSCGSSTGSVYISSSSNAVSADVPNFTFSCTNTVTLTGVTTSASDSSYTIMATGSGWMTGYIYTIDSQGNRQTTSFPAVNGTKLCWLLKAGDC